MVVECKFDGDRIQIHKNGTEIHFFSRQVHKCALHRMYFIFLLFFTSACGLSPFHLREFLFSPNLPCMYAISDVGTI